MTRQTAIAALTLTALSVHAYAADPAPPRYRGTAMLPTHSEGFHDWPSDELSAIEFVPNRFPALNTPAVFLVLPDDRSKQAPARIGTIEARLDRSPIEFGGIRWAALRDEKGRVFEKNTVDPEAVRFVSFNQTNGSSSQTILWTSEGYGKGGVQPAIYSWQMDRDASTKWRLPEAFLHDDDENPTRGIRHNNGFEGLAIDSWQGTQRAYAPVERPLIQDTGTGVCRVLSRNLDGTNPYQYGYPLGPAPDGTDPDSLAVAEMLCVGPKRFLTLENAEMPDGETAACIFWCSTDGASDLTGIESLAEPGDAEPHFIEKKLLLDLSTLPNGEGLGNFEGMAIRDGTLYLVEDNEHGKSGPTRMLLFTLRGNLQH